MQGSFWKFVTLNINIHTFNKVIKIFVCGVVATTSYYLFCTFIKVVTLMFIGLANLDWWLLTSSWWCVKVTCKYDLKKRLLGLITIWCIVLFDVYLYHILKEWKNEIQERKHFCFRNIPFRQDRISYVRFIFRDILWSSYILTISKDCKNIYERAKQTQVNDDKCGE